MNDEILKAWDNHQKDVRKWIASVDLDDVSYGFLLKNTIKIMFHEAGEYSGLPDFKKVTIIDNGDYQGTMVFVIAGKCYQPDVNEHWYTCVGYGSCSGCDTIQGVIGYDGNKNPTKDQVDGLWTLCLHMMQRMKRMSDE